MIASTTLNITDANGVPRKIVEGTVVPAPWEDAYTDAVNKTESKSSSSSSRSRAAHKDADEK